MKKIANLIFLSSLVVMISATLTVTTHVAAHTDHEANPDNECATATQSLNISTVDGTDLQFDKTELKATKGACVMIKFFNTQFTGHDFTLERANGSEWAHLHLEGKNDNTTGQGLGMRMIHLQMPNEDITFDFYCSVSGHRFAGMGGQFIVGDGSGSTSEDDSTGLGFVVVFTGLLTLILISPKLKNKF